METAATGFGAPVIEHSPDNPVPADVTRGANWFFWIAIISAAASTVTYFGNTYLSFFSFAASQMVSGAPMGWINVDTLPFSPMTALIINIGISAIFALIGYVARMPNAWTASWAFLLGLTLYIADSLLSIGLRDIPGFAFHMLVAFFIFKGLVATRRLYQGV